MRVLFEDSARPLLIAHAVLGFAAVFAATHHAVASLLAAAGRPVRGQLQRLGWIAPAAILSQALFGLALYPAYRVRVRFAEDRYRAIQGGQRRRKDEIERIALCLYLGALVPGDLPAHDGPVLAEELCGGDVALALDEARIPTKVTEEEGARDGEGPLALLGGDGAAARHARILLTRAAATCPDAPG